MRGHSLKNLVDSSGIEWTMARLEESMDLGRSERRQFGHRREGLIPEDFSIRELAEAFCGEEWVKRLDPRRTARYQTLTVEEAGEGVDVSAFSNITGQIFFNKIRDGWDLATQIGEQIAENIPTDLDGEKMPWISEPLSEGDEVHPGMPFGETDVVEEYITTPSTKKQGKILSIFKETIFFDRTGQMLRKAGKIGQMLGYNKERQILNLLVAGPKAPLFDWRDTFYQPFQTNGTYWTNLLTTSYVGQAMDLVDWQQIEQVEIAATKILEPDLAARGINTPIDINLDTLLVTPFKKRTALRTVRATEVRGVNEGTTPAMVTIGNSPITEQDYRVLSSKLLYRQAIDQGGFAPSVAQRFWWVLDSKNKPIAWMENWPLRTMQQPPNSTAEFERDIVWRMRADFRGIPAWLDPRYAFWVQPQA